MQPISKLLNDLLITSALNLIGLLQFSDFPTDLYLGPGSLIIGKISA